MHLQLALLVLAASSLVVSNANSGYSSLCDSVIMILRLFVNVDHAVNHRHPLRLLNYSIEITERFGTKHIHIKHICPFSSHKT